MPRRLPSRILLALVLWGASVPVSAQQRPLTTEDPEVIGDGRVLVEAGVETDTSAVYPLSGLTGNRFALPVGVCVGLGRYAELELTSGYNWLGIESRADAALAFRVPPGITRTSDVIDVIVATKIRVVAERAHRPSFGVRFETRLPNATNESGLGLDTFDFYFSILIGKTIRGTRLVGNASIGILGDTLKPTNQSDAFRGGVSVLHAVARGTDLVGEIAGQSVWFAKHKVLPPGAEPLGEVRAGVRYTRGRTRFDGGMLAGFTKRSPGFGVLAGVTFVGQAF